MMAKKGDYDYEVKHGYEVKYCMMGTDDAIRTAIVTDVQLAKMLTDYRYYVSQAYSAVLPTYRSNHDTGNYRDVAAQGLGAL